MDKVKSYILLIGILFLHLSCTVNNNSDDNDSKIPEDSTSVPETLPAWEEGYLDIHAINTGKGEATFFIMPDGTTMLVDAASSLISPSVSPPGFPVKPNDSKSPGKWISTYIRNTMQNFQEVKLDYIMLSHFHPDHMGGYSDDLPLSQNGDYRLSGITEVGDEIPFDHVIDRNWPGYDYPVLLENSRMDNYVNFLSWHIENRGIIVESFNTGAKDQIVLRNSPKTYPNFEVRNIASNGVVWTGQDNNTENTFPDLDELVRDEYPSENDCSIAFHLSYGKFDYFSGGDMSFVHTSGNTWQNIEATIAPVVGPVEALKANHHGTWDAMGETFLSHLKPRTIVVHAWRVVQPRLATLERIYSNETYTGIKDVFVTNITQSKKQELHEFIGRLRSTRGHVVIRVKPGGDSYNVYVLDDSDDKDYGVEGVYGPYSSK